MCQTKRRVTELILVLFGIIKPVRNLVIGVVIFLAVLAGWYFIINQKQAEPTVSDFKWVIEDAESEYDFGPSQRVALRVANSDSEYVMGTYRLDCRGEYSAALEANQLNRTWCSYGGAGLEFGVFFEDGKYFIKERQHDEGSATIPGGFGEWKVRYLIDK